MSCVDSTRSELLNRRYSSIILSLFHKHMGGSSIIMIKKEAVSHVECGEGSHIFVCQLKIGNVGVLLHPFYVNRFGDDDDATLD